MNQKPNPETRNFSVAELSKIRQTNKPLYNKLLGMAMLAMVAGGPTALTSCKPGLEPDPIPVNPVARTATQTQLIDMIGKLGLAAVTTSSSVSPTSIIRKGDVVEFGFHDDWANTDIKLKINEELCTKDKMVFDGTGKDFGTGQFSYIRYNISKSSDGGTIVQEQVTKLGKPISENSGWKDNWTFKYVPKAGGIAEYAISADGTEFYDCDIVPKTPTSVSKLFKLSGERQDFTNISIVEK